MVLLGSIQRQRDKENLTHISKHLNNCEEMVSWNMKVKGAAIESSEGNEKHISGNWRKGIPMVEQQRAW